MHNVLKAVKNNLYFNKERICRTPPPPYPTARSFLFSFLWWMSTVLNRKKENQFSDFLFFELWLIVFPIYGWHIGIFKYVSNQKKYRSKVVKFTEKMHSETDRKTIFRFFFGVIVDYVPKIHRKIDEFRLQKRPYLKN